MNLPNILGLLFLSFSASFLLVSVAYGLSKNVNADFDLKRGLFPFIFSTLWFGIPGCFFEFDQLAVYFLKHNQNALNVTAFVCVLQFALYTFKFKESYRNVHFLFEMLFRCCIVSTLFCSMVNLTGHAYIDILSGYALSMIVSLYATVAAIEKMNASIVAIDRLYRPWRWVKTYLIAS